ncbi:hypothetical protein FF1_032826 [Malus domestica]
MALHGSGFCLNGNVFRGELNRLPCSCIYTFGMLHPPPSPYSRKNNLVVAKTVERGHKVPFFPGYRQLKLRTEESISSVQASRLRPLRPCYVIGDDSKESSSGGESFVLDAQTLERDLDIAIAEEDYAKAAQIRDSLKLLMQDSLTSVRTANAQFYEAFRIGDLAAMQALWAQRKEVCCVHPGARGIYGYEDVMTSWDYVWANYEFPLEIELKDVNVYVRGDVGYVSCVELVKTKGSSWGGQFATNVFEKIDGNDFRTPIFSFHT